MTFQPAISDEIHRTLRVGIYEQPNLTEKILSRPSTFLLYSSWSAARSGGSSNEDRATCWSSQHLLEGASALPRLSVGISIVRYERIGSE